MKYLKTFENHSVSEGSFKDNLYNASTILTGKPKTWETNRNNADGLTKKVVDILIERGYELSNEAGTMTDSVNIWAIQDQGMQPIVLTSENDRGVSKIMVRFYFPTKDKDKEEMVEIDENDLEGTADNVVEAIEKLKNLGHRGNIFSKQGSIRLGLED